ncbi:hypothetical protein [Rhizobium sp. BG4]|uniref:hypothetical protein n=1 Tax=Rhizobium sp. BG4 TaxID=2613770 RepID=UPI001AF52946|nr:hypothetical protein [Rhizobium sp. BG4]QRM45119.1 hypothetical protein F2982_17750 [Rhizobium sp. BG4]
MYRIALSKMLVIVRLVIIVSLAGYTLSNANAAMHGNAFPEVSVADVSATAHAVHLEAKAPGQHAAHHHAGAENAADGDNDQIAKQECCKDFCGGFGIICDGHDVGGPIVAAIRQFVDDRETVGELPVLHRPPNI